MANHHLMKHNQFLKRWEKKKALHERKRKAERKLMCMLGANSPDWVKHKMSIEQHILKKKKTNEKLLRQPA